MLQEVNLVSPSGVDYSTFDPGYSSSKSYHMDSSMGAQVMIQHGGISLVFVREIILTDWDDVGVKAIGVMS